MGLWRQLFGGGQHSKQSAPTESPGKYVKENSWDIYEGLSVKQVDRLLSKNGFEQTEVELPAKFGADPPGYKYPCWRNAERGISVTSTFKNGKLLEFSWWF